MGENNTHTQTTNKRQGGWGGKEEEGQASSPGQIISPPLCLAFIIMSQTFPVEEGCSSFRLAQRANSSAYFFQWVIARSAIVTQTRHPPMPIQAVAGCHTSISGVRGAGGEYVHPFGALPMTVCFHLFFFHHVCFLHSPPPDPFSARLHLSTQNTPSQITHRDGAREGKHTHTMRGRCGHFLTTARKKN